MEKKHKCLACGRDFSTLRRGLCQTDYERFRAQRNKFPEDKRSEFESFLIAAGKLAPDRQGSRGVDGNVFSELAKQFRDSHGESGSIDVATSLTPEQQAIADETAQRAASVAKKSTKGRSDKKESHKTRS